MAQIMRVRTVFNGVQGAPYYSNLYFDATTPTPVQVTNAVTQFWQDIKAVICNDLSWTVEGDVAVIDDVTGNISDIVQGTENSSVGTDSADMCPLTTQGLIRARTGTFVAGREIRGRIFIPCPSEGSNLQGAPTSTYTADLTGGAAALITAGVDWVIWSRARGQSAQVGSVSTWNQWATLRSRRD